MGNEPKYSIMLQYEELFEDNIENIKSYLENGIIVYLFIKGKLKNEYEENFLDQYIKYRFLYVYEDVINITAENAIIAVDGDIIRSDLYSKICEDKNIEFNNEQYEIITSKSNLNMIVISGAGTGKTTTMINRLIFLRKTEENFDFKKVVLITFTNKASIELREKLLNILGKYYDVTSNPIYLDIMDEAAKCHISTIHSFAKKLINDYGKNISINKNIQVRSFKYKRENAITQALNMVYQEEKELYDLMKYYPLYLVERKFLELWDKLDNYSISLRNNSKISFGEDEKNFSKFLEKVIVYAQNILDRDKEYQFEASDLMKKLAEEDLLKDINNKFDFMMVDEFQDSDNIQIDFIADFCRKSNCNLMVVGDEKQSIYRFRGAEHNAFYRLRERMRESVKELKEFSMVRNYRTDSGLLEEINKIFIDVDKKINHFNYKENDYIYSEIKKGEENKINYIYLEEPEEKISFYTDLLEHKEEDETVAILFRNNNDIKEFKKFCDANSILCRVDVTGGFYRHEAVRDLYIMIKALIESMDNNTLYSFIQTPYISSRIDKEIILKSNYDENNNYFEDILNQNNWNTFMNLKNEISPIKLIEKIIDLYNPIGNYYRDTLINARRQQKNYKKIAYAKTLEYKLNLEHLLFLIKDKFSDNSTSVYQIEQFLKLKIATDNSVDVRKPEDKYENDFLQCLTVHKAKGLEYDYVVLPKLTNRFINYGSVDVILRNEKDEIQIGYKVVLGDNEEEYKNDIYSKYLKEENNEILGEEARLLYVALTRCKSKLYLNMNKLYATEALNTWKSLIGGAIENV